MTKIAGYMKPDSTGIFSTSQETDTIVWSLVKKNMPLKEISKATGISPDQIRKVIARKQHK